MILGFVIFLRWQINTWSFKLLILVKQLKGISGIGIERILPLMAFKLTYRCYLNLHPAKYKKLLHLGYFMYMSQWKCSLHVKRKTPNPFIVYKVKITEKT